MQIALQTLGRTLIAIAIASAVFLTIDNQDPDWRDGIAAAAGILVITAAFAETIAAFRRLVS